jgi:hypothetical protein
MGMSASIRIRVPGPGDPHGMHSSGAWWITGSCRPAALQSYRDRTRARRIRNFWVRWRTQ